MDPIQVASQLDGVSPLKDGGMSIRFHTQELTKPEMVNLMGYYQTFGWLMFKPDEFKPSDIPAGDSGGKKNVSKSQLLRRKLYVLGTMKGLSNDGEHEAFYNAKMEAFLDLVGEWIEKQKQMNEGPGNVRK
jgi:hypothetical protein